MQVGGEGLAVPVFDIDRGREVRACVESGGDVPGDLAVGVAVFVVGEGSGGVDVSGGCPGPGSLPVAEDEPLGEGGSDAAPATELERAAGTLEHPVSRGCPEGLAGCGEKENQQRYWYFAHFSTRSVIIFCWSLMVAERSVIICTSSAGTKMPLSGSFTSRMEDLPPEGVCVEIRGISGPPGGGKSISSDSPVIKSTFIWGSRDAIRPGRSFGIAFFPLRICESTVALP